MNQLHVTYLSNAHSVPVASLLEAETKAQACPTALFAIYEEDEMDLVIKGYHPMLTTTRYVLEVSYYNGALSMAPDAEQPDLIEEHHPFYAFEPEHARRIAKQILEDRYSLRDVDAVLLDEEGEDLPL